MRRDIALQAIKTKKEIGKLGFSLVTDQQSQVCRSMAVRLRASRHAF